MAIIKDLHIASFFLADFDDLARRFGGQQHQAVLECCRLSQEANEFLASGWRYALPIVNRQDISVATTASPDPDTQDNRSCMPL